MFKKIAIDKINELIKREDFVKILEVDSTNKVVIKFEDDYCTIDMWGRVVWL